MTYSILYESSPWHKRAALFNEQGKLVNIHHDDIDRPYTEGAVFLGRVKKIVKGLKAAFIDIGDMRPGFLPFATLPADLRLTEGMEIMVRITRAPVEEKGAKLDARVIQKRPEGKLPVPSLLFSASSCIRRCLMDAQDTPVTIYIPSNALHNDMLEYVLETNIKHISDLDDCDLYERLDEELQLAEGPEFPLQGGGRLTVEKTKALTAIDVDAGGMQYNKDLTPLDINKIAATAVANLCFLHELGGNILVDFLTMRQRDDKLKLQQHMEEAFVQDRSRVEILQMSRFGLVEVYRQRNGADLMTRLRWPNFVAGDIILKLMRHVQNAGQHVVVCAPMVAESLMARLNKESVALTLFGCSVDIIVDENLDTTEFKIHHKPAIAQVMP